MKCRDCGTTENLKKDKSQATGYRSICYNCDSKRQRIKKNGYDTGSNKQIPVCKDCGESDLDKLCPDKACYLGVKRLCKKCAALLMQKQRQKPHSKHLDNHKKSREKRRRLVLEHYGNKCARCDEKHYEFLAIDHVNDDGYIDRKDNESMISKIIKEGYPDTYQILCHNHNSAKSFYKCDPIAIEKEQIQITEGYMGEGI